jgi:hypothetical protein
VPGYRPQMAGNHRLGRPFGHHDLAGDHICCLCSDTPGHPHSPCLHHKSRCVGGPCRLHRACPCYSKLCVAQRLLAERMSYLQNSIPTATSDQEYAEYAG